MIKIYTKKFRNEVIQKNDKYLCCKSVSCNFLFTSKSGF
jgi:hypothetical protein